MLKSYVIKIGFPISRKAIGSSSLPKALFRIPTFSLYLVDKKCVSFFLNYVCSYKEIAVTKGRLINRHIFVLEQRRGFSERFTVIQSRNIVATRKIEFR